MSEKHDASYWWKQSEFYAALQAEAERQGHVRSSIKFADAAHECRIEARIKAMRCLARQTAPANNT